MDIYCSKCGEPWEIDSLHDRVKELNPDEPWMRDGSHNQNEYEIFFNQVRKEFTNKGCEALGAKCYAPNINPVKNGIYGALMEFAGDDIDFAASMMEDAQSWGLFGDEFDD